MAETPVKLTIDGFKEKTREVRSVDYKFFQAIDSDGQITGLPRGGKITLRLKALNNGNAELLRWMLQENEFQDIKIEIKATTTTGSSKTIEANAKCVHYKEDWTDGKEHYEEIVVVCKSMHVTSDINKATFETTWE